MKYLQWFAAVAVMGPMLAQAAPDISFTVEGERVHQSFNDGDADLDTITFAPALHWQDWSLSASLPWQHIEGTYFVNNAYPNLEYVCGQINQLTAGQKLWLIYRGTLTAQQVQYCNQTGGVQSVQLQDEVQGWSDFELFANYYLPTWRDNLNGTLGIGYKHDNGNVEEGLGTGTRETFVESTWLLDGGAVGALITLGYQHILHNATAIALDDYGYGTLEGFWRPLDIATLGVEYHYRQAAADVLDDFDYLVYYLRLGRGGWSARVFLTDYQDETGYPDEEFGGSLAYTF